MTFQTPEEMLETIQSGVDLYSPSTCIYLFVYNEEGSICEYYVDNDEAEKLSQMDDYWGAHLGTGGWIHDTAEYLRENYGYDNPEDRALGFCKDTYTIADWIVARGVED